MEGAVRGDTWRFSQTCSRRFADLLMKPRLSGAPIPEDMKGEPIPSCRSLNCLSTPAAQLAHINGCRASAMLSQGMSRCRLPSGKIDDRRMKPSTMDHQLSSQGLSENSLKMMWGVTLLRRIAEEGKLNVLRVFQLWEQGQRAGSDDMVNLSFCSGLRMSTCFSSISFHGFSSVTFCPCTSLHGTEAGTGAISSCASSKHEQHLNPQPRQKKDQIGAWLKDRPNDDATAALLSTSHTATDPLAPPTANRCGALPQKPPANTAPAFKFCDATNDG